jgi:isoleucyl-tRNA synthetase
LAGKWCRFTGEDVLVQTESKGGTAVASDKGVTVAVDTHLTPELVQEGYARDMVRQVNSARKDAGLEISDRIELTYQAERWATWPPPLPTSPILFSRRRWRSR